MTCTTIPPHPFLYHPSARTRTTRTSCLVQVQVPGIINPTKPVIVRRVPSYNMPGLGHEDGGAGADHQVHNDINVVQGNDKDSGRERLKRHREEVAGRVSIPDKWGKEELLRDWMDYSSFDSLLAPNGLASARKALMAEGRRSGSQRMRTGNMC